MKLVPATHEYAQSMLGGLDKRWSDGVGLEMAEIREVFSCCWL
jgi:hypothetical protein